MACRVRMRARQEDIKIEEISHSAEDVSTGMQQTDREGIQMLLGHFGPFKTCEEKTLHQEYSKMCHEGFKTKMLKLFCDGWRLERIRSEKLVNSKRTTQWDLWERWEGFLLTMWGSSLECSGN